MNGAHTNDRSGRFLVIVFTAVIGSFLGSSLLVQYVSSEIGGLSEDLATNTAPSVQRLASIRSAAMDAEAQLWLELNRVEVGPQRFESVERSLQEMENALQLYLALPLSPGEREIHDAVQQRWARFEEAVRHAKSLADRGDTTAALMSMQRVDVAAGELVEATMQAIEFNAAYGQKTAARIQSARRRSILISNILTAVCSLLGTLGGLLLYRQAQNRRVVSETHARELEERAAELEAFAARMAHDIRGPLHAATLAASVLGTRASDSETQRVSEMLRRNIDRANSIVEALLEFARSGAKPDPSAKTALPTVVDDLVRQLLPEAAEREIELVVGSVPPLLVGCSEGVYLSLLGNLIRNAVKYMGDSEVRRIDVTIERNGNTVRTTVEDTGPGIPAEHLASLFEPYYRGDYEDHAEGLGLGLPTVRKLAESHGGSAGVESTPGEGSRFWFDLPCRGAITLGDSTASTTHG